MMDLGKAAVMGVGIDVVDLEGAAARVLEFASLGRPYAVTALAVHGVVEATHAADLARALNDFDLVLPDGQPVRWALNALYGVGLPDKVPGPALVDVLLGEAAERGLPVFFYGSTPDTLFAIEATLEHRYGGRLEVHTAPSRFGRIGREELGEVAAEIDGSGARLCFVGLGCPRQERFTAAIAPHLQMPVIAVGAAFNYLCGRIDRAPAAVQRLGLEWAYRIVQEPRLARRYLTTNPRFAIGVGRQLIRHRLRGEATPALARSTVVDAWELVDA